jgi:hypothetical protein
MNPTPATLASHCPWCGAQLSGDVFASFADGRLLSFAQTRHIGSRSYTWTHSEDGCFVPQLQRIPPSKVARNFEAMKRRESLP